MSTYRKLELLSIGSTLAWTGALVASRIYTWSYEGNRFAFMCGSSALEVREFPSRPNEAPHVGSGWTVEPAASVPSRPSLKLPRIFKYAKDATGSITLIRVIVPLWIPLTFSLVASIAFRQLNPSKRIHFLAGAFAIWRAGQAELRYCASTSFGQPIRKLPLIGCSLVALTLAILTFPLASYPIFFQIVRPNNTIVYFEMYKSALRLGTFSTPKPAMLHFEADSSRGFLRIIERSDSHEMFRLQLPGAVDLMQNGMNLHDLVWKKPSACPDGTIYQNQLRSWTGTPMTLFALWPGVAFIRGPINRCLRRSRGLCLYCGYNLSGNVSGVCPECGRAK